MAAVHAAGSSQPDDRYARHLSEDRGCPACHAEKPAPGVVDAATPPAPTWQDIARRYRDSPDAEQRLAQLVLAGSSPGERHWKGHAQFDRMLPNEIATTPEEAHRLVRWILSFR